MFLYVIHMAIRIPNRLIHAHQSQPKKQQVFLLKISVSFAPGLFSSNHFHNSENNCLKEHFDSFHLQQQQLLMYKLAGIRVNRFFDYSKRMTDDKGRHLVEKTYKRLMKCIQEKLEAKNLGRFYRGDLTYQYLEPKWLTNSIHVQRKIYERGAANRIKYRSNDIL